ncbi:MAG: protein translocase subunit SecF [Candidatus Bipolaricaulota bacterium]|nr:protein translocase subunit SecF [Candidatus Bipolaricaulota bacterium]
MRPYRFDFLGKAKYWVAISIIAVLASVGLLLVKGVNLGIDFTGGLEFTVKFSEPVATSDIRQALGTIDAGGVDLRTSKIQQTEGNKAIITTKLLNVEEDNAAIGKIDETLRSTFQVEDISRRLIGRQVSQELAQKGWQAILLAFVALLIYVSWRFRLRYAVAAVVCLVHDVTIALGIFVLFGLEIDLETVAAFLTIIGYSLNDTIVIFDRIRENLKIERKMPLFDVINLSVNQSLSRTLNTNFIAVVPVAILLIFGGSVLRGFSVALLVGMIVGTYSTMYVANPILYAWAKRADRAKQKG